MPVLDSQLVMHEEDFRRILRVISRLVMDARARGIFVVDKNGQLIAETGELQGVDGTSLASLVAGCVAATGGLARLVGEAEFPVHFHQGKGSSLHMSLVGPRMILAIIFDERTSLGLVRLRARRAGADLARIFEDIEKRAERDALAGDSPFAEITDDDIDNLFSN